MIEVALCYRTIGGDRIAIASQVVVQRRVIAKYWLSRLRKLDELHALLERRMPMGTMMVLMQPTHFGEQIGRKKILVRRDLRIVFVRELR